MRAVLLLAALASAATACRGGGLPLGEGCVLNSECVAPLVCAYRRCHQACESDRDCAGGLRCRSADRPFNVCLLDGELACPSGRDSECPGVMVCGPDLVCRDPCKSDRDCLAEQLCVQGLCAAPAELTPGGKLPSLLDGGEPPCLYNSDCAAPRVCRSSRCVVQCREDRDCAALERCAADNRCVPWGGPIALPDGGVVPEGYGASCIVSSNCATGLLCLGGRCGYECFEARDCSATVMQCCAEHRCTTGFACSSGRPDGGPSDAGAPDGGPRCSHDAQCSDGLFCNGNEQCLDGKCEPGPRSPCDDSNPCTLEACDEPTDRCMLNLGSANVDADNDGHTPVACGFTADDCDDGDPTVYTGAHERCDFVDNNCNGQVDEALWAPVLGSRVTLSNGGRYPPTGGPPVVEATAGGLFVAAAADQTNGTIDVWRVDPMTLSPMAGPAPALASGTAWSTCVISAGPFYGRRSGYAALAASGPSMVVLGLLGTHPTTSCCEASVPPIATAEVRPFDPALAFADGGALYRGAVPGNGCSGGFNTYDRGVEPVAGAWSPALAAYILTWADERTGGNRDLAWWAAFDPRTGALGAPRQVVQTGGSLLGAEVTKGNSAAARVLVASSPTTVMMMWLQSGTNRLRYVVFNAQVSSIVMGPVEPQLATPYTTGARPSHLEWDGAQFIASIDPLNPPTLSALLGFHANGALRWGPRPFAARSGGPGGAELTPAGDESTFRLVGDAGIVLGVNQGTRLRFAWGNRHLPDAGFQWVDFPTYQPNDQRTDFSLAPLGPRRVVGVWADGNLQQLAFECND